MQLSPTEENYVKIIYKVAQGQPTSDDEITTNQLAELTQTKPASVSDMLKKLAQKNLVHYVKYQGVRLTEAGSKCALHIIRKHRLWEYFLVNTLQFKWDEVHDIAEQLEHIQSNELVDRLASFLNYPQHDPHGDPIPDANGIMPSKRQIFLIDMPVGSSGEVMGVRETSPLFLRYLDKLGVSIGSYVEIVDKIEFDQSVEVKINRERTTIVSKEIAQNIYTLG